MLAANQHTSGFLFIKAERGQACSCLRHLFPTPSVCPVKPRDYKNTHRQGAHTAQPALQGSRCWLLLPGVGLHTSSRLHACCIHQAGTHVAEEQQPRAGKHQPLCLSSWQHHLQEGQARTTRLVNGGSPHTVHRRGAESCVTDYIAAAPCHKQACWDQGNDWARRLPAAGRLGHWASFPESIILSSILFNLLLIARRFLFARNTSYPFPMTLQEKAQSYSSLFNCTLLF
eukprot:1156876-Pelagomonas_calceolata.AAC.4